MRDGNKRRPAEQGVSNLGVQQGIERITSAEDTTDML